MTAEQYQDEPADNVRWVLRMEDLEGEIKHAAQKAAEARAARPGGRR